MKAVIVEICDKFAAALLDDGRIIKVKNNNYAIGKVIEMKKEINQKSKKIAIWAAASAAAFIIMSGTGAYVYASPYSYVSLDVNPSIEYSLNRFDHVISVKAVNDDGEEILKKINIDKLNNKKIDEVLELTVDQLSKDGYFDGDIEGGIVISTSAKDLKRADKLAIKLQQSVKGDTEENGDTVEVEAISVGKERVEKAKELGVTPGKLNLVEKLQASALNPESINIEEWLKKPVKEIMKATRDNKKEEIAEKKEETAKKIAENKEEIAKKIADKKEEIAKKVTENKEEIAKKIAEKKEEATKKVTSKVQEKINNNAAKGNNIVKKIEAKVENKTSIQEQNTSSIQDQSTSSVQDQSTSSVQDQSTSSVQEQNGTNEEQKAGSGDNQSNSANNGGNGNR